MSSSDEKGTFYIIPHTHWEGAVFQTRDAYLDMGLAHILRALALLKAQPSYRFTLDQVCYVKPFLERYPEQAADFRRLVDEGRLAIVGGTDSMLDVNMPGGESFVRQVLYGKGYFRETLGADVTVGWQLDTFGHHAQMPQLLKQAGFRSFWFFRGVPNPETPAEFRWEGIDGTRFPVCWMPHGYGMAWGAPNTLPEFSAFVKERYDSLAPNMPGPLRPGPAGVDVCPPEPQLAGMVEQYNAQDDAALRVVLATPQDYEAAMGDPSGWPVLRCELNPVFQGIYSSRIELKQWTRELEGSLTTAEKLGVILGSLGMPTCDENVWRAWEPMLFNQAHDIMSGVLTDHVYEDTAQGFDLSRRIAREETEGRLRRYCSAIDTRGAGTAVVVHNALGWSRTDAATVTVGFTEMDVRSVKVLDPGGGETPAQIVRSDSREDGTLVEADVAFVARDVPALGHAVYRVVGLEEAGEEAVSEGVLENELYRVEVDTATGAITGITVKEGGWEALREPGNIVVQEEDRGDFWEPYKPLDGGSRFAMTQPHPIPPRGEAVYSDEFTETPGHVTSGPVVSEFTVEHAFGERGRFATRVRVYAGLARIEVQTRILNNDKFVRYRAMFPTSIEEGTATHEIPFGAIERPEDIEFPAQNWVDYGDGARGVALLNRGLPGNATPGGTLLLSLLRSTQIVAYGFGGGYERGMTSDTGFELDKELTFDYALVPHAGDWREAGVYREGQAFNAPLMAVTAAPHEGALPAEWGYLDVEPGNVLVSTLKASAGGLAALRVYEAAGVETPGVRVRLPEGTARVEEANLVEDAGEELRIVEGAVEFDLGPYEIKTLRLTPNGSQA